MPSPKQQQQHKCSYKRSGVTVAKRLRWLQLSELTYTATPVAANTDEEKGSKAASEGGAEAVERRQWEMVQRTTHRGAPTSGAKRDRPDDAKDDGAKEEDDVGTTPQHVSSVDICCIIHKKKISGDGGSTAPATATTRRYLVLVSQYRPPMDAFTLEMPAGLLDSSDESPTSTAARELFEETGYVANVDVLKWHDAMKRAGEEEGKKGGEVATKAIAAQTNTSPTTIPSTPSTTTFGPLSYDPGLSDDLFELVRFDIHLANEEDGDDKRGCSPPNGGPMLTRGVADYAARMAAANRYPQAHNDVGEDTVTHLLALDGDDEEEREGTLRKPSAASVLRRLERLRRSIHPKTVVDGKLQTLVLGFALASE